MSPSPEFSRAAAIRPSTRVVRTELSIHTPRRSRVEAERRRLLAALDEVRTLRDAALATASRKAGLTSREAGVIRWVREGKTNREIAEVLGMSDRTVQEHVERVLSKMGAKTRLAAARRTFE